MEISSQEISKDLASLCCSYHNNLFGAGPTITNLTMSEYFAHENFIKYFKNLYFSTKDILPLEFSGNALQWSLNGSFWTIPLEVKCYFYWYSVFGVSKAVC